MTLRPDARPALARAAWCLAALTLAACGRLLQEPAEPWHLTDLTRISPTTFATQAPGGARPEEARITTLKGRSLRAFRLQPGERATWSVSLGREPRLSFRPRSLGEGCRFVVTLGSWAETSELLNRSFPTEEINPNRTVFLDLGDESRIVDLTLEVRSTAGAEPCRAGLWGSLEILDRRPTAAAARAPDPRPNILLLGIDTLRADALGAYGSPIPTPAVDRLAAQSDVWLRAFTTINNTNPSFVSLFTGLYPKDHGIYDLRTPLPESITTLTELLHDAGYATRAIVSAHHLGRRSGLHQGFDLFELPDRQSYGETVVDQGMLWIQEHEQAPEEGPFFIWLHLFDAHVPHDPPGPYHLGYRAEPAGLGPPVRWLRFRKPGRLEFDPQVKDKVWGNVDLYPGEVAYVDRQIDRLLTFLESRELFANTVVALVADHGETLGERGHFFDHAGLHDNTAHVPLMIHWPGQATGRRLAGLVQHFDLFPTLLGAAGVAPPSCDGQDLRGTAPDDPGRRVVFAEDATGDGWMVRSASHKLLVFDPSSGKTTELFDLERDPGELENLAGTGLAAEDRLRDILDAWKAKVRDLEAPRPAVLDEDERRDLEALGYLQD